MNQKTTRSMKLRTVYMPPRWTQLLAELVKEGYYANISHAIRVATRELLQYHGKM